MSTSVVVFVSLVLDLLAFTLILPLLPSILDYYSTHDESGLYRKLESVSRGFSSWIQAPTRHDKVLFGGLLGSWFSLLQFFVTPFAGAVSDVIGRRIVLLFCLAGMSLSYATWSISRASFAMFCLSRTVGGISKGNVSLSTAIVSDISDERHRGKGMAMIGVAFSVGFIVGPMIGAILSSFYTGPSKDEFFLPALLSLLLSLTNLLFTTCYFEESLPMKYRAVSISQGLKDALKFVNPMALFTFRPVARIETKDLRILRQTGWIYFHFLFIYSGLEYTLSFLTHQHFKYTSLQQGKMYLFVGLIMAFTQGTFVRKIKTGYETLFAIIGILLIIPAFVIIGWVQDSRIFFLGLFLYSISSAIVVPMLTTLASRCGPKDQKGVSLGIFRSIGSLARAFGPLFASAVFWRIGPLSCYLGGGLLFLLPLLFLARLHRFLWKEKLILTETSHLTTKEEGKML